MQEGSLGNKVRCHLHAVSFSFIDVKLNMCWHLLAQEHLCQILDHNYIEQLTPASQE